MSELPGRGAGTGSAHGDENGRCENGGDQDFERGVVPPGRYAHGERAPIVWVLLCAGCAGFAPFTDRDYDGFLSGICRGCHIRSRELHRFRAWIDTAAGCNCTGSHRQAVGDVWAADNAIREHPGRTMRMSTYTETFCDVCNSDREYRYSNAADLDGNDGCDRWRNAFMPEAPSMGGYYGWATFVRKYPGDTWRRDEYHVCAACLADPERTYGLHGFGEPEFDEDRENVAKGRALAEAFAAASETLDDVGKPDRWGGPRRIVQMIGQFDRYCMGPRPAPREAEAVSHAA